MTEITIKRTFKSQLGTGVASLLTCFVLAMILWPIWSTVMKAIFTIVASQGLTAAGPKAAAQLLGQWLKEASSGWLLTPGSG
jgi:hypothetical protein